MADDPREELRQLVATGMQAIRARDPALGALLDSEPPSGPVSKPLLTRPSLQRLKRIALRIKPLRPALRLLRAVLIRVRSRMRS
jgi:hypothetical protein